MNQATRPGPLMVGKNICGATGLPPPSSGLANVKASVVLFYSTLDQITTQMHRKPAGAAVAH